jgi:hypothetical protein
MCCLRAYTREVLSGPRWGWINVVSVLNSSSARVHGPTTVAARFKAWNVFARSNAGMVGSNPTNGMHVYVVLRKVAALRRADPSSKES